MTELDKEKTAALLNAILEEDLAGVVRYTHYSFLIFGHARIPIVSWLRDQANESLLHSHKAGEMITLLGAYPSLEIGPVLDRHEESIDAIMREALDAESRALGLYRQQFGGGFRQVGDAGGICPANDPRRRAACRRSRENAAKARLHSHLTGWYARASSRRSLTPLWNSTCRTRNGADLGSHAK